MAIQSVDDIRSFVRAERKRRRLTQGQTAEIMGHTQKWLSDFESGKVEPSIGMILSLLRVLGQEVSISSKEARQARSGDGDEVELDQEEL